MIAKKNILGKAQLYSSLRIFYIAIAFVFFAQAIFADSNSTNSTALQYTRINTTTDATLVNELHAGGNISSYNYLASNGSVSVYVNGQNIYAKTDQLSGYISSMEGTWSHDSAGTDMVDIVSIFQRIAKYKAGEINSNQLTDYDIAIMNYMDLIAYSDSKAYFDKNIQPRDSALVVYHDAIQKNAYETEALYRTLEKTDGDVYCQSRIEVAQKYNLSSVKCGLHSKMCYNGDLDKTEDGRDYCIEIDNDHDYLPCINTYGRCGKLTEVKVALSEENGFIPVVLSYYNPGPMNLSPAVRFDIQKIDSNIIVKSFREELGNLEVSKTKTYKLYLDNSGVAPGKYDLWVTVISGRKEILQKFEYTVLSEGSLPKTGEFSVVSLNKMGENGLEVIGSYKNDANAPSTISMTLEVYKNESLVETLESSRMPIESGEIKQLKISGNLTEPGSYEIIAGIKGAGITKKLSFNIEPKPPVEDTKQSSMTGNFIFSEFEIYSAVGVLAVLTLAIVLIRRYIFASRSNNSLKKELV